MKTRTGGYVTLSVLNFNKYLYSADFIQNKWVNNMSINRNASMRPETNPAGNLLQEISEAELNQLSAGAGEPRASWGDFCTSTLECTFGTMICCPPET